MIRNRRTNGNRTKATILALLECSENCPLSPVFLFAQCQAAKPGQKIGLASNTRHTGSHRIAAKMDPLVADLQQSTALDRLD
jgi:hypothetical protein